MTTTEDPPIPEKPRKHHLLTFPEIPPWYQDNPHIHTSYRAPSSSTCACVASTLYLHNETMNIYTHLLPCVIFLLLQGLIHVYLNSKYVHLSPGDRIVFEFFLFSAAACFGVSAAYHTLMCHSERVEERWLKADFVGIVGLVVGILVSGVYMVFYCERTVKLVYWAVILTLGVLTVVVLVNPRFQGPRWRTFRICCFVGIGLSGLAPLAHGINVFGFAQMAKQSGMAYYISEGFLFGLGALFYSTRIPESFKPGKFDLFGCSHQIFHLLVFLATVIHLVGLLSAFDYNYKYRICGLGG